MRGIDEWLKLYARDHKNPTNKKIHHFCVPAIMFSLLGLLAQVHIIYLGPLQIHLAHFLVIGALIFYFTLDKVFFALMFVLSALMLIGIQALSAWPGDVWLYLVIFIVAWIGQFLGHKIEGQKPSFFEDIQFLLIGPLWVFKNLRERIIKSS